MAKKGRPFVYQSAAEKPVTVSLRLPRAVYDRVARYVQRYPGMTLTEFFLDGARLRLDTPADPRDIILSDDNTVIQEVQAMIRAAVQAEIGKLHGFLGPPGSTPEDLPAEEASAPASQSEPLAAPHAPADLPPAAAGMKWCQKGLHQYPATRAACRQCATLRQQKHRANKAKEQGGAIPAL